MQSFVVQYVETPKWGKMCAKYVRYAKLES